jgi:uncharacterized protein (UPF0333 family)
MEPEVILVVAAVLLIIVGSLFYAALTDIRDAARVSAREAQKQSAAMQRMGWIEPDAKKPPTR